MPSYRKNTSNRSRKPAQTASLGWVWLFFGMFLGIGMAVLLYGIFTQQLSFESLKKTRVAHQKHHSQTNHPTHSTDLNTPKLNRSQTQYAHSRNSGAQAKTETSEHVSKSSSASVHAEIPKIATVPPQDPHKVQSKKKSKSPEEEYEFYTLLPGMEVQLPDIPGKAQAKLSTAERQAAKLQNKAETSPTNPKVQPAISANSTVIPTTVRTQEKPKVTVEHDTKKSPPYSQANVQSKSPSPKEQSLKPSSLRERPTALQNRPAHSSHLPSAAQSSALSTKTIAKKSHEAAVQTKMAATQYILQAGLFKDANTANSLKARLALQGFSSHIQRLGSPEGNIGYRVMLGPFSSEPLALVQKQKLEDQKIHSVLILQRTAQ